MKIETVLALLTLTSGCPAVCQTLKLTTHQELLNTTRNFSATLLFVGHGSKSQFADVPALLAEVDKVVTQLNARYSRGNWLAVFGGDPYNPEKPDIGVVMKHLKDSDVPVMAIQSDVVIEWGGVDKYIDFVHWVPTATVPETGVDGKPVVVDGQVKVKIVWGGFVDGKPVGPTATYLGADFISGPNPILSGVIAFGGGPIALEELKYASARGVPIKYVRVQTRYPEVNGRYGSVDEWARNRQSLGRMIAGSCASLFIGISTLPYKFGRYD